MTKRAWGLGWVVAVLAVGSFGCSTLPRAGQPSSSTSEGEDMLADVELTEAEQAQVAAADAPVQRENSVDVSWKSNGKHIQLAKNPQVQPVTASMIRLDKRDALRLAKDATESKRGEKASDAPPRGLTKVDVAKD
jgi:hypothetical protein